MLKTAKAEGFKPGPLLTLMAYKRNDRYLHYRFSYKGTLYLELKTSARLLLENAGLKRLSCCYDLFFAGRCSKFGSRRSRGYSVF